MNKYFVLLFSLCLYLSCDRTGNSKKTTNTQQVKENYIAVLDTIFRTEQEPIRKRDSLIEIYGAESEQAEIYQKKYRVNHAINIVKIRNILNKHGWPDSTLVGRDGNRTICNILQHADQDTREHYLPLMKEAVLNNKLEARYLVRAEDRIATDKGELQIYGGQMKYYPETKSFNVWPVFDPINIDKRRAEIGLIPIAEHLRNRFDFEWNLEEHIKRTEEFKKKAAQILDRD